MSETKNVVIQQNNGTDYDILKPLRSIDDKLFGYWWKKQHYQLVKTYLGQGWQIVWRNGSYSTSSTNRASWQLQANFGDSLEIAGNTLKLSHYLPVDVVSKRTVYSDGSSLTESENTPNNYNNLQKFWGVYREVYCYFTNQDGSGEQISFGSMGGSSFNSSGTSYWQEFVTTSTSGYAFKLSMEVQGTSYVYSSNRNEYPDAGAVGSDYYTFLGIPFSNALFLSKSDIQV